jgi:hypothetical protein
MTDNGQGQQRVIVAIEIKIETRDLIRAYAVKRAMSPALVAGQILDDIFEETRPEKPLDLIALPIRPTIVQAMENFINHNSRFKAKAVLAADNTLHIFQCTGRKGELDDADIYEGDLVVLVDEAGADPVSAANVWVVVYSPDDLSFILEHWFIRHSTFRKLAENRVSYIAGNRIHGLDK